MAAYGRGQMLGAGINPQLMAVDYSPFADAAATTAQSNAALASSIGGTIEKGVNQFTDYKKQQAEDERLVQKSKSVAKAIGDLIPDLQPTIQESMMILDDKEVPLSRRKAEAEAISDILDLGINEVRNRQEVGLKQRQLGLQEADLIQRANTAMLPESSKWKPYNETFESGGVKYNVTGFIDQNGFFKRADGQVFSSVMDAISTPVGESGDGMVLPPKGEGLPAEEFPDAVPIEGTPISPSLIEGVPTPLDESVYNTIPSLPGEVIQNIEAAGTFRPGVLPPGVSIAEPTGEGKTYTIDELKELKDQGVKFNAQPAKEEGKFTLTNISPATPGVQINMGDKRADKMDEQLFKQKEELAQAAAGKDNIIGMINLLNEGVKTGFGQDVLTKSKRVLGMDVSDAETFKARAGAAAMNFINLTKGAISDREMTYFTTVLAPNIGNSVEGNKKIADFMLAAVEKANKIEKTIADGLRNNENAFDIDRKVMEIRNSNEIIGGNTKQNSTSSQEKTAAEKLREKIKQ